MSSFSMLSVIVIFLSLSSSLATLPSNTHTTTTAATTKQVKDSIAFLQFVSLNANYSFGHTDMYRSWGGDFNALTNTAVDVTLWDSDGDVFFELRNGDRFCVIDGSLNLTTGLPMANVYFQQGCYCGLKACTFDPKVSVWNISVEDSETDDCQWDGTRCAPVYPGEQMTASITLVSPDYTINNASEGTYGGDVMFLNQSYSVMALWDSDGDVYFNISSLNGTGYCDLDFGANMYNWSPLLNVMKMRDIFCTVTEVGYHQFEVAVEAKPGWACNWNGYQWACLPVNSTNHTESALDEAEPLQEPVRARAAPSSSASSTASTRRTAIKIASSASPSSSPIKKEAVPKQRHATVERLRVV